MQTLYLQAKFWTVFENSDYLDKYLSEYLGLDVQWTWVLKIVSKLEHNEYLANLVEF